MKRSQGSSDTGPRVGLTRRYIVALLLIGALIIAGATIVDRALASLADDSLFVNQIGRQRLLAERVRAAGVAVAATRDPADARLARATLRDAVMELRAGRESLLTGGSEFAPGRALRGMARQIAADNAPYFDSLFSAAMTIADSQSTPPAIGPALRVMSRVESIYVANVDSEVLHLTTETSAAVQAARNLMYVIVSLVLLGLVGVAFLVLKPAVLIVRSAVGDLRDANRDLDVALNEARDAARLKSDFLATMSHELRTPLNAVIGLSGLLMETKLDDRQKVFASTVNRSGDALLGLINNILDLSKIDAGKLELEVTDFDLRELVESTAETFALRAEGSNVELSTYVTPTLPVLLRGDPGRIRQVLLNLVGNALKFTEAGSVTVRVKNVTGGRVRFEVTDTGIGIPADKIGKLFQPFAQVDASTTRRFGGTGLGLDISRRLVELMRGTIGVTSTEGKGSTFSFELPLEQAETDARDEHRISLSGRRVLVVDDTSANRLLLCEIASAWGMDATESTSPEAALTALRDAAARGQPFDVAFIDWQMPGMDGYDLAEAIRSEPAIADTPLIMLSSFTHEPDPADAARSRFSATVAKPIRQRPLLHALSVALGPASGVKSAVAPAPAAADAAPAAAIPRWTGRHVLVADDNPVNVLVLKAMLERHGIRADVAADGEEVLEAIRRTPYDLILMDVYMPRLDGLGATHAVREFDAANARERTPVVACTASVTRDDHAACMEAGMDDYVSKPVARDVLSRVLLKWLGAPAAA